MKQCLALLLAVAMMLSLCACSAEPSYEGNAKELETILDGIASIPVATMGVSMTITARSVELLDWCEVTSMSGDELAACVKAYYDALETNARDMFIEQVAVVINGIWNLSREEARANILESAGFNTDLNWDDAAFTLAVSIDDQL